MKHYVNFFIYFILVTSITYSQPGTLDNSFGTNGLLVTGNQQDAFNTIGLQKDGKIIIAGTSYILINGHSNGGFEIKRFNTDGNLDATFGNDGDVFIDFINNPSGNGEYPYSVAIQPDDKIIVMGWVTSGLQAYPVIARFNSDGRIDSSFSADGKDTTVGIAQAAYAVDMALQKDGKILMAGLQERDDYSDTAFIVRYLVNGTLDPSFANKGVLKIGFKDFTEITSIILQPDGKILLAGNLIPSHEFLVMRFLSDGSTDNTFGTEGKATLKFQNTGVQHVNDMALQADGKIVVTGSLHSPDNSDESDIVLAQFDSTGVADNSFGNGSAFVVTEFGDQSSEGNSLLVQPDGKIIVAGDVFDNGGVNADFVVARYQPDGNLDSSFSNNGKVITDIEGDAYSVDAILQPDGKIIVGGNTYIDSNQIVLARYNNDIVLPITYDHFKAFQTKQYITLNWQTTAEINNAYFSVQRSNNATSYAEIGQVKSLGTGAVAHSYAYTDKVPLKGINYYRLKQVDKYGKYSYSKIVSVGFIKPGTIKLYPNPAKDQLNIEGLNASNISTIFVLDVAGRILQTFTTQSANYQLNIGSLAKGAYIIQVKDNNGTASQKFIKE